MRVDVGLSGPLRMACRTDSGRGTDSSGISRIAGKDASRFSREICHGGHRRKPRLSRSKLHANLDVLMLPLIFPAKHVPAGGGGDMGGSGVEVSALVLQGGGALGSYQAGAYDALLAAGQRIDWVAGISIGAINGAIICGNPPERRVEQLAKFCATPPARLRRRRSMAKKWRLSFSTRRARRSPPLLARLAFFALACRRRSPAFPTPQRA